MARGRDERVLHRYLANNRGYKVNVKAIPIFHSLFFPIYETIKHKCENRNMSKWLEYFISSITAGAVCNICTNPIWVVRTRIMVQYLHPEDVHYKTDSIIKIMKQMVKEVISNTFRKGIIHFLGDYQPLFSEFLMPSSIL